MSAWGFTTDKRAITIELNRHQLNYSGLSIFTVGIFSEILMVSELPRKREDFLFNPAVFYWNPYA